MKKKSTHTFTAKLWLYPGESANWHFITLPRDVADSIKETFGKSRRGFGAIKVEVVVGKTTWQTSIFPDKISKSYILPIKASVRKAEGLYADDAMKLKLTCI